MIGVVSGCASVSHPLAAPAEHGSQASPSPESTVKELPEQCDDQRVKCTQLQDGLLAISYPSPQTSQGVLFWDLGGPGMAPLDGGAARKALPPWAAPFDVVTLAEPWTYRESDGSCEALIVGEDARGQDDGSEASEPSSCDWGLWRLSSSQVASALPDIDAHLGRVQGVYSESFGAVRSQKLTDLVLDRGGFAVLNAPAPSSTVSGGDLLLGRAQLSRSLLTHAAQCDRRCVAHRTRELDRLITTYDQLAPEDAAFGLLSLVGRIGENQQFLRALWANPHDLSRVQLAALRSAADGYQRRTSSGEPLEDLKTYLASVCVSYTDWESEAEGLGAALQRMHRLCPAIDRDDKSSQEPGLAVNSSHRVVLLPNRSDPVVPLKHQETWLNVYPNATVSAYSVRSHTSPPPTSQAAVARWLRGTGSASTTPLS